MKTAIDPRISVDEESVMDVIRVAGTLDRDSKLLATAYISALADRERIECARRENEITLKDLLR